MKTQRSSSEGSSPRIDAILARLGQIPWFANTGRTADVEEEAKPLREWDDWPGPEEPEVFALFHEVNESSTWVHPFSYPPKSRSLLERLASAFSATRKKEAERVKLGRETWRRAYDLVEQTAGRAVDGYDPARDPWHPQTAAVHHAAATAALMACCEVFDVEPPDILVETFQWFERGHWPCGYARVPRKGRREPLLVY